MRSVLQSAGDSAVYADLTAEDVERLHYLLGALRASLMLCEDGDVGAFTSELRSAFFANLASMATSAHAIASHITAPNGTRD